MKNIKGKSLMKRLAGGMLSVLIALAMMPLAAFAEEFRPTPPDGFVYDIYPGGDGASVLIKGYEGSERQIILPTSVTFKGVTYKAWNDTTGTQGNGSFILNENALQNNKTIVKIAIPNGYEAIGSNALNGCTNLTEIAVADGVGAWGIGENAFKGCDNVKTYYISGDQLKEYSENEDTVVKMIVDSGLARDKEGNVISGVTVYTKPGSPVIDAVSQIDPSGQKIKVIKVSDPYSKNTVKPSSSGQKGSDGTAYGPGASESVVDAAATKWSKESDPKGTVFGLLKAKVTKVQKTSVTVQWSKVKGAKKYVIYGNKCGKTKLKKLKTVTGSSAKFTKVAGKKVKKGTYYKFMVVALNKNNKVVSSSKIVHAATPGGKYGNDKAVTVKKAVIKKAKKLKKGKSLKLNAKAVKKNKKLKAQQHRKVAYESSNKKIATVSSKGIVKGKKKGTCYIYAYAQNGVFKKIKVTVK